MYNISSLFDFVGITTLRMTCESGIILQSDNGLNAGDWKGNFGPCSEGFTAAKARMCKLGNVSLVIEASAPLREWRNVNTGIA